MSKLFRDVVGERLSSRGSVVCIGAFDGLHLGHQALIARCAARAAELGADAAVVSFEPLPREYFAPAGSALAGSALAHSAPARLMLPRQKVAGLCARGADLIGLLRFDAALAAMTAEAFVETLLAHRLAAREVWIGADFRFGHRRAGDAAMLARLGALHGFAAHVLDTHEAHGARVSSTRVRDALAQGRLDDAAALLGRPYTIAGRVVRGKQLGRKLGYPTANLRFARGRPPMRGIFAARVHGVTATPWPAVASFGTRPTVGGAEPLLEAHLFDFDGDLYGRLIEVEFAARLRDEEKFPDLPSLVAQMDRDAAAARRILHSQSESPYVLAGALA